MRIAPTLHRTTRVILRRTPIRSNSSSSSSSSNTNAFTTCLSTARTTTTSPAIARFSPTRQFHGSAKTMSAGDPSAPAAAQTDAVAAQNAAEMAITPESISRSLEERIGATYCAVEDMSGGCGQAFEAIIVSPQFEKKTTLARHRLVNGALRQEIAAIHAWTPRCFTPEEWAKKQGSGGA